MRIIIVQVSLTESNVLPMKQIFSTAVLFLIILIGSAQEFQEIIDLVGHGDGMSLAAHMNSEIDISINDERSTLDRNEGGKRLVEFFQQNPIKSFDVVHKGTSKSGVVYLIGQLESEKSSFRMTMYIRGEDDHHHIESIEIEEG